MNIFSNPVFIARLKSFAWRAGLYGALGLIGFVLNNIGLTNLSVQEIAIITFILNEITKWVSDKIALGKVNA